MKVTLFDFQKEALNQLREKFTSAQQFASSDNPQAIAFSAPTGSGKTVMLSAFLEALLDAPDEQLDWPMEWTSQPDSTVLWVSDMPELNEQSKMKIERTANRIGRVGQLQVIDSSFDEKELRPGCVYFINTQKLGTDKRLTKVGDGRQYPIWETLSNTARKLKGKFIVVIDEAHRGMLTGKNAKEAQTLMQRFLLGHPDTGLVRMPLVIGISATPRRFMDLLENAPHTVHKVSIPADEVRKSGLLKDRILLHHPESGAAVEMSLLEQASIKWQEMNATWSDYCAAEDEEAIWPILVVQVENAKSDSPGTKTNLELVLSTIEGAIGRRLHEGEAVHAMHDTGDLDVGGRRVRRVDASKIDGDKSIGVVIFKTSLSTGWDCPRAEVMMSFRSAEDHTYIAQLMGRMVRTPLARRVENLAELNDVHLYLPKFDADSVKSVVTSLQNSEEVPPAETGSDKNLVVLHRLATMKDAFAALSKLTTYRVNAYRQQSDLRRYLLLATNLQQIDEIDSSAWNTAKDLARKWINQEVTQLRKSEAFKEAVNATLHIDVASLAVSAAGSADDATYQIDSSEADIDRAFSEAGRVLGNGLHFDYVSQVDLDAQDADEKLRRAKAELIAMTRTHESVKRLQQLAENEFDLLFDRNKHEISMKLTPSRQAKYDKLRLATATPKPIEWKLPESIDFRWKTSEPTWPKHIYVNEKGLFRSELGSWEKEVLEAELASDDLVGWLRNLDRKPWSFEIPYQVGAEIRPMFPDLVVVRKKGKELIVDILEPHDPSLSDNAPKALGLARFAEKHGGQFGRIQLIRKGATPAGGSRLYRLDFNKSAVRKRALLVTTNEQLNALFDDMAE